MTLIINILICLTIFATIHVATFTNTKFGTFIDQLASDSYRDNKIADLEKIVLDLASRLQDVENKNQVLENKNKDITKKLAHQDNLLMDVTSRVNDIEFKNHDHEFKSQDTICKENFELRSKIEDIIDEFQKHVTSSEVQFGVIEQLFEDHETTSDSHFAEVDRTIAVIIFHWTVNQNIL